LFRRFTGGSYSRESQERSTERCQLSPPEPPSQLHQEHVVGRSLEEIARIAAEGEVPGVGAVLPTLRPHCVERRARTELPAQDRVHPERLEVEVGVDEAEGRRGPGPVWIDGVAAVRVADERAHVLPIGGEVIRARRSELLDL